MSAFHDHSEQLNGHVQLWMPQPYIGDIPTQIVPPFQLHYSRCAYS